MATPLKLIELGLDDWFKERAGEQCNPEQQVARVIAVDRGRFTVRNESGEFPAKVTGRIVYAASSTVDYPCVGDWVCLQYRESENFASIHSVLERKSLLRRKTSGKDIEYQMIAANIDAAFIVQACHFDFNVSRLERYLVMANESHVEPYLVLTKTDLITPDELEELIAKIRSAGISIEIIAISNVTGAGITRLREVMHAGETYCLLGSSGVGKTTLINQLLGEDALKTSAVSETGEGRHTTVRRQLIVLAQGAMLVDTPGMRELGIMEADEGVEQSFADIEDLALGCRFTNCSHTSEPGCAVLKALQDEALNERHYQNYLKLKKEAEFNESSYAEKRKKDKAFGRMVQSAVKHKGKNR
jgi:ribosome biogenesis GTPase